MDEDKIFGNSEKAMCGFEANGIAEYGTFWERKDARKLRDFASCRVRRNKGANQ